MALQLNKSYKIGDVVEMKPATDGESANPAVLDYIDQIRAIVNSNVIFHREISDERTVLIARKSDESDLFSAFIIEKQSVTDQTQSNLSTIEIPELDEFYVGLPISLDVRVAWLKRKLASIPRNKVDELYDLQEKWTFKKPPGA